MLALHKPFGRFAEYRQQLRLYAMSIFTNRIVVEVSGGLVSAVYGDGNTEVLIVDHDNLNVGETPGMAERQYVQPLSGMDSNTGAAVRKFNQVVAMPEQTIMARVLRRLEGGAQ